MTTMDYENIVDEKLFKIIGLHQLLYPTANSSSDNWYRKVVLLVLCLIFGMHMMQVIGLYFILRDLELFMNGMMLIMCGVMCIFKAYVSVTNVERLRSTLDVTRYTFTSCSLRDTSEIRRCRVTVSTLVRILTTVTYSTLVVWIAKPWFIEEYVSVINMDGTVSKYRIAIFYQWYPVSESVYNSQCVWILIYAIQTISVCVNVYGMLIFDCYVLTVCLAFKTHFNILSATYEALGCQRSLPKQYRSDEISKESEDNNKLNYYDELFDYLKDNQKILIQLNYFYDVIRSVISVQIFNGSFTSMMMIYLTILAYTKNGSILSVPVLQYFCGFVLSTMELYIYCYIFTTIEIAKSAVNFGLYSSNWTEMDLKFKKSILLAMNMNSIYNKVMKISPKSLFNLEMLARVMKMSYTIVSVLLNISDHE